MLKVLFLSGALGALAFVGSVGCSGTTSGIDETDSGSGGDEDSGLTFHDGGGPKDASRADSSSIGDSSIGDSSSHPDGSLLKDGGVVHVDGGHNDGGACRAGDISTFTPVFKGPTALHQGVCSVVVAGAYIDCLFDDLPDTATCAAFLADVANKPCTACALTANTSAKLGPMIADTATGLVSLNFAGCIGAVDGNATSAGCGAKVQAADQCAEAACGSNCPVESVAVDGSNQAAVDAELAALNACQDGTKTGVCSGFGAAALCADTEQADGGPASICAGPDAETFQDAAKRLTILFCH